MQYLERFVVVDLETTGHSPENKDKIIEIGIVIIENDKIVEKRNTLLNPNKSIPPFISNLTNIKNEDVEDAPIFEEKADTVVELFKDSYLIAHNVPFDMGFLNTELKNSGRTTLNNRVIDTVELSRILFPKAPGYKLGQLAEYLDINHNDPHRALSDAIVTAKLFLKLKEKLSKLPFETLDHLSKIEKLLKSDLYFLLEEFKEKAMMDIFDEPNLVTYNGLAFKMEDDIEEIYNEDKLSYGDFLDEVYEAGGSLSKHLKNYEKRPGQRDMSEIIFDAFQVNKHGLIEAETGTGKSLAYLLPAVYEAVHTKSRIVISTYTTQLQSQLLEEEIPLLQQLVPFDFHVVLLKGRNHYLSLERFSYELANSDSDNYDITLTKAILLVWLTETLTGDIDEIQLPTSGYSFYNRVSSDAEGKTDGQSPWVRYSYYLKAKRKAQKANIVITNHALLCTDMFNDYQFLPSYNKLIIDEAHHLENTAAHHYGLKLDNVTLHYTLNQIGRTEDNKAFDQIISKYIESLQEIPLDKWDVIFDQAKREIDDLFQFIYNYVFQRRKNDKALSDIGRIQYRFNEQEEIAESWEHLKEVVSRVTLYLRDLIHILALIDDQLEEKKDYDKHDKQEILHIIENLQLFIDRLELLFLVQSSVNHVQWIEIDSKGINSTIYLYSEPTDVSTLLMDELFSKKDSVILTSATLTMKNTFDFIRKRLGLDKEEIIAERIVSPFSFKEQVQLLVPNDFPALTHKDNDEFIYATSEAILSLAEITEGRMLVLFTSYDMLRKTYKLLKEIMDDNKYMLIGQGITSGSRSRLKKNFQSFERSILLGTSSFWEGVDIPGKDLSCLMIVRLPFQPPNHPVFEAKSNELKEQGKNPFMELSLPNAVIKFKQGFGRLIRTVNDRGIVFVCDARIINARYGKYFTESIPDVPILYDSTHQLIDKAEDWF
ncbi:ATP-dependent DNA helicase DinG [Oceanobacillus sp. CAU 1775]